MNSGMRLTAAFIAIVVIATGIYYASLGNEDDPQSTMAIAEADTQSADRGSDQSTESTPAPSPSSSQAAAATPAEPAPSRTTSPTPATTDAESDESTPDASVGTDDAPVDGASDSADDSTRSPDVVTDGDSDGDAPVDAGAPGTESSSDATSADADTTAGDATNSSEDAGSIPVQDDASATDAAPGAADADPVDPNLEPMDDQASPVVDLAPGTTPGSDGTSGGDESTSPEARRPGRDSAANGLGGHVLVPSDATADVLNPAARAFGQAASDLVIIPVDQSHAWLALPSALQDSPILESVVVASRNDSGMQFVLVREDLAGSLSLGGRVAEAEVTPFPGTDEYRIRYRVDQDQLDSIRRESSVLIGKPVAWVVDGAVVAISRPRIAISQRSMLPISTNESAATRLASIITGKAVAPIAASEDSEASETDSPEDAKPSPPVGRPARAGELPEDAYTIYTIKPNDTPSSIAQWWFGDANKYSLILNANPLVDPNNMKVGDELRLPPKDFEQITIIDVGDGKQPVVHIVQSGENLSAIALAAYGNAALWPRIYEANKDKIKDPSRLDVGTELIIP